MKTLGILCCFWLIGTPVLLLAQESSKKPDRPNIRYDDDIAPLLKKYCAGCHNDDEPEGAFSLETYASLLKGTENGPAVLATDPGSSRLYRLLSGVAEPKMPPEGEPAPSAEEIDLVRLWIEQGARGPAGAEPDRLSLHVPQIASKTDRRPVTALAWSPKGEITATAKGNLVEIARKLSTNDQKSGAVAETWETTTTLSDFVGKVNSVHFCGGGEQLITASGVAGLGGVATLWDLVTGQKIREFKGHRDIMFDAEVSPDGKFLATCSYDRSILLWDLQTGTVLREFSGHNGAVYDLEFSKDNQILVSASADATCKVWRVSDGSRLDTLGQPLKEQYCASISPDGRFIAAGGADNRIRIWRLVSKENARINPLAYARFAHEGPIVNLAYTADGKHLISMAEDKTIKVWETKTYTETELIEYESEVAMSLAIAPDNSQFVVGRLDGSVEFLKISGKRPTTPQDSSAAVISPRLIEQTEPVQQSEQEPNQSPASAQLISIPAIVRGTISPFKDAAETAEPDADCFRFSAKQGEEWVFEINAERSKSKLDSYIEVVSVDGNPIERLLLQAVRDSYFTFRGKTADQTGDFRLFNWEEMELNEYLYANGEVVKLWLYPRGPDSGFDVYPGSGKRWGYFDTTPLAHALGEPCYIVQPHPPGTVLIPNGLPVFKLYYKNDDEAQRKLGKDSKLFFVPPVDGEYVVRVRDVRGMEGDNFNYTLTVRPRQEDFSIDLAEKTLTVPAGGAKEIRFNATRIDQFEGPVTIRFEGLPPGYSVTSPITIEAGQIAAEGVLSASQDAKPLKGDSLQMLRIIASAEIRGTTVEHPVGSFQELIIDDKPKLQIAITPAPGGAPVLNMGTDGPLEFEIAPGETIMLQVQAERIDFKGEISFGKEDAGRNLPHGLYVDNIGLNGLLLLEDQSQREFFITAAKWSPEQSRLFHLRSTAAGSPATQAVLLHVRHKSGVQNSGAE